MNNKTSSVKTFDKQGRQLESFLRFTRMQKKQKQSKNKNKKIVEC